MYDSVKFYNLINTQPDYQDVINKNIDRSFLKNLSSNEFRHKLFCLMESFTIFAIHKKQNIV